MSASDVALSAGLRSNLLLLQSVDQKMARSQERLSTGLKINTALDSPPAYFAAKGLTNKASDLMGLKDAMGQAINTVKAGTKGIASIQSLVDQARGLTTAALGAMGTDSASQATRQSFAKRFDEIMDAINGVGDDSGYGGKNLLKGNGYRIDPTPESKLAVNNLPGIGNARVTNMKGEDSYRVEVLGTGAVTGNPSEIANAEQSRGVAPIVVSGTQSGTQGNFNPITVEVKGPAGRDKQITVGNPPETATYAFTQDQWKTAKAAGQPLKFDHTFGSGARISFPVNFDQIEGTQPNAGQGVSAIEKHVDLQVKVTNGQDLSVVRDVNASAGNARLMNGENSFVFPSGTVRLNVDEKKLSPTAYISLSSVVPIPSSPPPPPPPSSQPTDFSLPLPLSAGSGFYTFSRNGGAFPGRVDFSFDLLSAQDVVEIWKDGVRVAATGYPYVPGGNAVGPGLPSTFNHTLSFDYTPTPTQAIEFRFNETFSGSGWNLISLNMVYSPSPPPSPPVTPTSPVPNSSPTIVEVPAVGELVTKDSSPPGTANDLSVAFDAARTNDLTVQSQNLQVSGQGLQVDYSQNGWCDQADIEEAAKGLDTANQRIRSAAQALNTGMNVITTRDTFTKEFSDVLEEGANKLTLADQNEEGSNVLMLQTRKQLGMTALSLAAKSQQTILSLFG